MSWAILSRCLAITAAASTAMLPIAVHAQAVGINAAVRNNVQIRGAGTPQLRPAVLRQRVNLNDEVRTGAASQLQILLLDRSTFTVGQNARLTVDRFVYDPNRPGQVSASVARGAFRFISGRSLGPASNRSVRTPVATIGIRGTILEGAVGPEAVAIAALESAVGPNVGGDDNASLIVLRGPGARTLGLAPPGAIDVTVGNRMLALDRPSLAVYIPGEGRAPIGPFRMSEAGLIRIQQLLVPIFIGVGAAASTTTAVAAGEGRPDLVTGGGAQGGLGEGPAQPSGTNTLGGAEPVARGPDFFLLGGITLAAVLAVIAASGNDRPVSP